MQNKKTFNRTTNRRLDYLVVCYHPDLTCISGNHGF